MTTPTDKPVECSRGHRLGLEYWGRECPQCKEEDGMKKKEERMTRETYYLTVLEAVRQRSTCDRGKSGAIIVKKGRIVTTGYAGAPVGMPHCDVVGHLMESRSPFTERRLPPDERRQLTSNHCIRTVHAELNAILQAARFGIPLEGTTIYCSMTPCYECAKAIVNVGIVKVIAVRPYQAQHRTIQLFRDKKISLRILLSEKETY